MESDQVNEIDIIFFPVACLFFNPSLLLFIFHLLTFLLLLQSCYCQLVAFILIFDPFYFFLDQISIDSDFDKFANSQRFLFSFFFSPIPTCQEIGYKIICNFAFQWPPYAKSTNQMTLFVKLKID